jgi:hypothetical protein
LAAPPSRNAHAEHFLGQTLVAKRYEPVAGPAITRHPVNIEGAALHLFEQLEGLRAALGLVPRQ